MHKRGNRGRHDPESRQEWINFDRLPVESLGVCILSTFSRLKFGEQSTIDERSSTF
jgi:hypothetical protein